MAIGIIYGIGNYLGRLEKIEKLLNLTQKEMRLKRNTKTAFMKMKI